MVDVTETETSTLSTLKPNCRFQGVNRGAVATSLPPWKRQQWCCAGQCFYFRDANNRIIIVQALSVLEILKLSAN